MSTLDAGQETIGAPAGDDPAAGVGARVARGAGWLGAGRLAVRLLGFLNTIVLARLLAPEDFGLVAVAVTAMQLLQGFSDVGVGQAVVRFRDAGRRELDTLFTLGVLRGVLVAGLLAVAAPFAAAFFGDPRLFWVFLGVAVYPLAVGLANPKFFEFERDLDFSREFWATTLNKLAGVGVSVAVAVAFRSYWAIILGLVVGGLVQLVLSYVLRPYRPRLSFAAFDRVFAFTSWLAGVSFFAALNNKIDALIVARLLGQSNAGAFYIGVQLSDLPGTELAATVARAIFPGFSSLEGRSEAMRRTYLGGVAALGAAALPASLGFAFVAADLIPLMLGERWLGAVPVIQILSPVVGLHTLLSSTQYYAMANDKTRYAFFREMIFFFVRTPIFILSAWQYGLLGAAWAAAITGLAHCLLNLEIYRRVSGAGFFDPLWAARRSFAGCAGMAIYFFVVRPQLDVVVTAPAAVRLVVDIALGGAAHLAAQTIAWRAEGAPAGVEATIVSAVRTAIRGRFAAR